METTNSPLTMGDKKANRDPAPAGNNESSDWASAKCPAGTSVTSAAIVKARIPFISAKPFESVERRFLLVLLGLELLAQAVQLIEQRARLVIGHAQALD